MVNSFLSQKFLKDGLHSFTEYRKLTSNCDYARVLDCGDDVPCGNEIGRRIYKDYIYIFIHASPVYTPRALNTITRILLSSSGTGFYL